VRALVTGSRGFVGTHVAAALAARGARIVPLVRPVDYHDTAAVARVLAESRPAILVHCAWRLAPGSAYLDDPANAAEAEASLELFRAAVDAGCKRVVGLGTCLEYAASDGPVAEDAALEPRNAYARSKVQLFVAAEAWAKEAGISFAWARLYFPFGPGEPRHRLIPSVVNGLLRGERVATTEGAQRRSFLYAADVGDAIAAVARSQVAGPINVGTRDAVAVRTVVEHIGALTGRAELLDIGALPSRPGDPEVLWPHVEKLTDTVGWTPARDLAAGLRATIDWWQRRK
jgi:nucleoside-diphosphate-sugar epimerase